MRTGGCRVKPIGEILRLVGHQSFPKFHDAHRVRWYAIISQYEFREPESAAADNSPDRKTLVVWLDESARLNVVPGTDPLARLRIIKYCIFAVDFMFDLEIARVRSIPMALQRLPHASIIHLGLPPALPTVIVESRGIVLRERGTGSRQCWCWPPSPTTSADIIQCKDRKRTGIGRAALPSQIWILTTAGLDAVLMSRLRFLPVTIVLSLLPVVAPAAPAHKRPAPRWPGYSFLPGYHQPPNSSLPAYA